jgi:hypothetical protein
MRRAAILLALGFGGASLAGEPYEAFQDVAGVRPLKATLNDVTKRFGAAKLFPVPEGHYESAICYIDATLGEALLFHTNAEFGRNKIVTGISVQRGNPKRLPCSAADLGGVSLSLGPLHLGESEAEFRSAVGPGVVPTSPNKLMRHFEYKRKLSPKEQRELGAKLSAEGAHPSPAVVEMDVSHSVWGVFSDGTLVEYGIWRMETF